MYMGLNPHWIQCKKWPEIAIRESKIYYRPISAISWMIESRPMYDLWLQDVYLVSAANLHDLEYQTLQRDDATPEQPHFLDQLHIESNC